MIASRIGLPTCLSVTSICLLWQLWACFAVTFADEIPTGPRATFDFDEDPEYLLRELQIVHRQEQIIPVWTRALQRGDRDLLCKVAEAVFKAIDMDHAGLGETFAGEVLAAFEKTDDPTARRALARVLVQLDYHPARDAFQKSVEESDYALCLLMEPALGHWNDTPTIQRNLQRLQSPQTIAPWRMLAVHVLRHSTADQAQDALLPIVMDSQERFDMRIEAARSLAAHVQSGLSSHAQELLSRSTSEDRISDLLAVEMIAGHDDETILPTLQRCLQSSETTVHHLALTHMFNLTPQNVAELAGEQPLTVQHPHSGVRSVLIRACFQAADARHLPKLATFLDDAHPGNRELAMDAMFAVAQQNEKLRPVVVDLTLNGLAHSSWRVLEQSALLAAGLELSDTGLRMQELVAFERPEVRAAAAYALKEFQSAEAAEFAVQAIRVTMQHEYDLLDDAQEYEYQFVSQTVGHLCELLGRLGHAPADPVLRGFIKKAAEDGLVRNSPRARGMAIYALGQIHKNEPEAELVKLLAARMTDENPYDPEYMSVREASAIALGKMRARAALADIQKYASRNGTTRTLSTHCAWSLQQITGQEMEIPSPVVYVQAEDWFLRELLETSEPPSTE